MKTIRTLRLVLYALCFTENVIGFAESVIGKGGRKQFNTHLYLQEADARSRRSFLAISGTCAISCLRLGDALLRTDAAYAAVGTLPELQGTNAVLQGLSITVTDPAQQKQMITFLEDAFDMEVLRQTSDGLNTWLGYGPEQLSVPDDFTVPVSSFKKYGGHASIHIQYDPQSTQVFYRGENKAPGSNIAFLQVGVPQYRVSQMVKNGGNVLDAYGYVNVISPAGLPMRGIVGIWPDPIMFCAINCVNINESKSFYEKLGFAEQSYPYCRPGNGLGQFEPPQPKGSVYMAPSPNSMGVLLLPFNSKKISPNPSVQGLNIVYSLSEGSADEDVTNAKDPSGVGIFFDPIIKFATLEQSTRVTHTD